MDQRYFSQPACLGTSGEQLLGRLRFLVQEIDPPGPAVITNAYELLHQTIRDDAPNLLHQADGSAGQRRPQTIADSAARST